MFYGNLLLCFALLEMTSSYLDLSDFEIIKSPPWYKKFSYMLTLVPWTGFTDRIPQMFDNLENQIASCLYIPDCRPISVALGHPVM